MNFKSTLFFVCPWTSVRGEPLLSVRAGEAYVEMTTFYGPGHDESGFVSGNVERATMTDDCVKDILQ